MGKNSFFEYIVAASSILELKMLERCNYDMY